MSFIRDSVCLINFYLYGVGFEVDFKMMKWFIVGENFKSAKLMCQVGVCYEYAQSNCKLSICCCIGIIDIRVLVRSEKCLADWSLQNVVRCFLDRRAANGQFGYCRNVTFAQWVEAEHFQLVRDGLAFHCPVAGAPRLRQRGRDSQWIVVDCPIPGAEGAFVDPMVVATTVEQPLRTRPFTVQQSPVAEQIRWKIAQPDVVRRQ
ncbi:conserved hypothetical protein [Trichinella spiralis]|uniref:hypothetical protein n=1 Tax=Trichinella spiralis TaxID=6334 RepID=UPI0001EFC252|nr:conserved hypothetical protein [Trichinella spiralis]